LILYGDSMNGLPGKRVKLFAASFTSSVVKSARSVIPFGIIIVITSALCAAAILHHPRITLIVTAIFDPYQRTFTMIYFAFGLGSSSSALSDSTSSATYRCRLRRSCRVAIRWV
jgi:hypothetical protein